MNVGCVGGGSSGRGVCEKAVMADAKTIAAKNDALKLNLCFKKNICHKYQLSICSAVERFLLKIENNLSLIAPKILKMRNSFASSNSE